MDRSNSIQGDGEFKVYKRRWYVLIMYSMYAFTQSAVWNTWGPISTTSDDAFGWRDSTIALLTNWGPVSYILTGLFYPWLLQVKGLRWATLSSMFFVAAGTAFRVITSEPHTATILIHIGQFLNGVGGPISTGSIPALSAAWFPPNERVTATALSNSINNFGSALTFILGPALVTEGPPNKTSGSSHLFLLGPLYEEPEIVYEADNVTAARHSKEREQIMRYMYYTCGWSVLLFLVMLCYFPSKPRYPPCISATMERTHYWAGLWSLRNKGYFLIIALSYGISTGVMVVWASVMNINLQSFVEEETAGWIGFYSTLAGCAASLLVGRFADRFVHYMKMYILVMYILATVALIVLALMLIKIIPSSIVGLYVTIIMANGLVNAAVPLMYELACELAFPTSEAAANGLLTYISNFWGLIFLAVFFIPNVGVMWMNWTVIGSTAVCIPLIALIKGRFNRLEVDEGVHTEDYTEQEVVIPEENGIQNPLLEDDENICTEISTAKNVIGVKPDDVAISTSDIVTVSPRPYGIHLSSSTDDSEHFDTDSLPDVNFPEQYGIQEPLLPIKKD